VPEDQIDIFIREGTVKAKRGWYEYKGEHYRRNELDDLLKEE